MELVVYNKPILAQSIDVEERQPQLSLMWLSVIVSAVLTVNDDRQSSICRHLP